MKILLKNKYFITAVILLFLLIAFFASGSLFFEGENPIKIGVTVWYLEDTNRNVLRIASENNRYLAYADSKEDHLLDFMSRTFKGSKWKYDRTNEKENKIILIETKGDQSKEVIIPFKYFLNTYILFDYSPK